MQRPRGRGNRSVGAGRRASALTARGALSLWARARILRAEDRGGPARRVVGAGPRPRLLFLPTPPWPPQLLGCRWSSSHAHRPKEGLDSHSCPLFSPLAAGARAPASHICSYGCCCLWSRAPSSSFSPRVRCAFLQACLLTLGMGSQDPAPGVRWHLWILAAPCGQVLLPQPVELVPAGTVSIWRLVDRCYHDP